MSAKPILVTAGVAGFVGLGLGFAAGGGAPPAYDQQLKDVQNSMVATWALPNFETMGTLGYRVSGSRMGVAAWVKLPDTDSLTGGTAVMTCGKNKLTLPVTVVNAGGTWIAQSDMTNVGFGKTVQVDFELKGNSSATSFTVTMPATQGVVNTPAVAASHDVCSR